MSGDKTNNERKFAETATWAVAVVCAVIVLISILLEKCLLALGTLFKKKQKVALYEALDRVKGDLMVAGFISLILTFTQGYISKQCVPERIADTMLPCSSRNPKHDPKHNCKEGYEPLITGAAVHELHTLIFFLAVFHVLYSAMILKLGQLKIQGWKNWERLASKPKSDQKKITLTEEADFPKRHNRRWVRIPIIFYVGCFLRQFFKSVLEIDYKTLRHGFITAHHVDPRIKFNFQKYIKRSLEDDFKTVVSISPVLWASFVIFLLLNASGLHTVFWAPMLPLICILAIGTKLQTIIKKMAQEIVDRHSVIPGIPPVKPSDDYFWFNNPHLLLHLLHFTLFQNAFQITYHFWIWFEYGLGSCLNRRHLLVGLITIAVGICAMVLCSYSTLPLFALLTQMGSTMKKNVFEEQMSRSKRESENNKGHPRTLRRESSKRSIRRHSFSSTLQFIKNSDRFSRPSSYEDEISTLVINVDNDQGEGEMTTLTNWGEITEKDNSRVVKCRSMK